MEGGQQTWSNEMLTLKRREVEAVERSAVANEELIRLATAERVMDEQEPLPPMCPHCGTFDPRIRNESGQGRLSEFALVAQCECGQKFIAVPATGWLFAKDKDDLQSLLGGSDNEQHP